MIDTAGEPPGIHARGVEASIAPGAIVVVVAGPLTPSSIVGVCASLHLLEGGPADPVVCELGLLDGTDAGTVDALARLQLTARRHGRQIRLRHASSELQELLALMGLRDVLPLCGSRALRLEAGRQAEKREQGGGIEKEDYSADPLA